MPVPALFLVSFSENGLTSIYTSKTQEAFDTAFDNVFSHNVVVTINGQATTRHAYKQQVWQQVQGLKSGTVTFPGAVQSVDSGSELVSFIPMHHERRG